MVLFCNSDPLVILEKIKMLFQAALFISNFQLIQKGGLRVPPSSWSEKRVYSEQHTCCTDKCDRANERSILDLQIVRGILSNSKIVLSKFSLKIGDFAHFGLSKWAYSRKVNIITCFVLLGL